MPESNSDCPLCGQSNQCAVAAGQPAQDRIELQQMRQRIGRGQVIDRHDLQIGVLTPRFLRIQGPEKVTPDTPETINRQS